MNSATRSPVKCVLQIDVVARTVTFDLSIRISDDDEYWSNRSNVEPCDPDIVGLLFGIEGIEAVELNQHALTLHYAKLFGPQPVIDRGLFLIHTLLCSHRPFVVMSKATIIKGTQKKPLKQEVAARTWCKEWFSFHGSQKRRR